MFTSENIQRYIRIFVYYAAGALTSYGVTVSSSNKELIAGIAAFLANIAWTAWGNTLNAKLAEVAKAGEVEKVVVNDPAVAAAVPSPKVDTPASPLVKPPGF